MAATKYQVMYRYMNDIMNVPITNDQSTTYDPTFEFYTDPDHRIFSSDQDTQNEELEKQQEMIAYANQASNPKNDMLFVYDGCKKILHQKWIEDQVGYVVRDWSSIRSKIGNRGDYSKEFTCLGAETPEDGAVVVCTKEVFRKYFKEYFQNSFGGATTEETVADAVIKSTIFQLSDPDWKSHAVKGPNSTDTNTYYSAPGIGGRANDGCWLSNVEQSGSNIPVYFSNIIVDPEEGIDFVTNSTVYTYAGYHGGSRMVSQTSSVLEFAWVSSEKMYKSVSVTAEDIETTTIPGHYEDAADSPYCIKDQYKRIESSPWLINCTVGSLEAALTKAKKLIEMVGLENVKVVKLVAIDQFLKIK